MLSFTSSTHCEKKTFYDTYITHCATQFYTKYLWCINPEFYSTEKQPIHLDMALCNVYKKIFKNPKTYKLSSNQKKNFTLSNCTTAMTGTTKCTAKCILSKAFFYKVHLPHVRKRLDLKVIAWAGVIFNTSESNYFLNSILIDIF